METLGGDRLAHDSSGRARAAVDLYWLPLGAGGHFVRLNGRVYEALAARLEHRRACDLYHSTLQVEVPEGTYVIEQAPVHDWSGNERGVVAEGAVGSRWAGRFRIFRYEIRLWRDGHINDVAEAVEGPRRRASDDAHARRVLDQVPQIPTPVWGRDQLGTGEMWNSNSVVAWGIARSRAGRRLDSPAGQRPGARLASRPGRRAQTCRRNRTERHLPNALKRRATSVTTEARAPPGDLSREATAGASREVVRRRSSVNIAGVVAPAAIGCRVRSGSACSAVE